MSNPIRLYDGDADELMSGEHAERVSLLPGDSAGFSAGERIRVPWGQDMLRDMLDGRYRTVICGVNEQDNSHGIVAQLVHLVTSSQWTEQTLTHYAKVFQESVSVHAAHDQEPYVLKYDLDSVLILALLRPRGQDHFTVQDLSRGFATISKMLRGRLDRQPVASVSFLGARSNSLVDENGREPSFETVLRTMYQAGYRGDVYPAPTLWSKGDVGVFATYPFPEGVQRMREGSS
ncbi:MAG: hypothetical protein ED559_12155 [Phycisphaera sp.]|nr:MAG: hypothetical protein ED559_12155 [Phycisphaera sp.]